MPYRIEATGDGRYRVVNADTGKVHARHTSHRKARLQVRLLNAREHGFVPTGAPAKR